MPAIQPARLKRQAALLIEYFTQPVSFKRSLHHLLEGYADRAMRPGKSGKPVSLLEAYNVRLPVLRELLLALKPVAQEDPSSALQLADALWAEPVLEFRMLAANLLGLIPEDAADQVLDRIHAWATPEVVEEKLLNALLVDGLETIRVQDPERLTGLIKTWLTSESLSAQKIGLWAVQPLVMDASFQDMPAIYQLLAPLCRTIPSSLRPELLAAIKLLARRSPNETAFFLRQNLENPNFGDVPWLIRQSLEEFPLEIQNNLRAAVRGLTWKSPQSS